MVAVIFEQAPYFVSRFLRTCISASVLEARSTASSWLEALAISHASSCTRSQSALAIRFIFLRPTLKMSHSRWLSPRWAFASNTKSRFTHASGLDEAIESHHLDIVTLLECAFPLNHFVAERSSSTNH